MREQLTILGPGLLGASLGMAAHHERQAQKIVCWGRRPEAREELKIQEWCHDAPSSTEEAVRNADMVILAVPVMKIVPLVREIAPHLKKGCLVTDVGSTKSLICRQAAASLVGDGLFIGSHPMAGSEKTGLSHARKDLFQGHPCLITPLVDTPDEPIQELIAFWRSMGMTPQVMSPEKHDEIVAQVSHVPHLLASILATHLGKKDAQWRHFAGNGLRDTTRIASGDPGMWMDIIEQNLDEITRGTSEVIHELEHLLSALRNRDFLEIQSILREGKRFRDQL